MSNIKINPQIIKWIKEKSRNDKEIAEFLIELVYEEAEHPGHWWWKDTYKKKVKIYSNKWKESDEN